MENVKFTITSLIIMLAIGAVGFLAYMALEKGDESGLKQQVRELKAQAIKKDNTITDLERRIAQLSVDLEGQQQEVVVEQKTETNVEVRQDIPVKVVTGGNAELLKALQALKTKNVVIEPGNSGPAVGTIQKFLNVYNKTSGGIDNDFGPGTRKKIEAFQAQEKISVDGGVGPGTLSAMISWLSKN